MKILFTLLLIALTSFGGEYGEISGRIADKQNLQPLENVNIYIARTTMGTSSDKNGEFTLNNIPPGRYRVILSHLSYKNHDFEIDVRKNSKVEFFIELLPTPIEFPEISVTDKYDTEWWDNFEVFSRALLGSTWFADGCEILNPLNISFEKDDSGSMIATSDVPIEIENRSLGYNITYLLKHFEYNFGTTKFSGYPFFEEMQSDLTEDSLVWKENRLEAYMGSLRHFLHALSDYYMLASGKSEPDDEVEFFNRHGFHVFFNKLYQTATGERYSIKEFYTTLDVEESERPNELVLVCGNQIQVEYFKEFQELNYEPQISYLKLHSDSVYFDKRGRYHDEYTIQTTGYMQKQRLAEMLPFEYEPSDSVIFESDFR